MVRSSAALTAACGLAAVLLLGSFQPALSFQVKPEWCEEIPCPPFQHAVHEDITTEALRREGWSDQAIHQANLGIQGADLFHALAGQQPYMGGTAMERLYRHSTDPVPDVRDFNRKVPEDLAFVIERMMAKDPDERYQTPTDLLEDLATLRPGKATSSDTLAALVADDMPGGAAGVRSTQTLPVDRTLAPAPRKGFDPIWTLGAIGGILAVGLIAVVISFATSPAPTVDAAPVPPVASPGDDDAKPARAKLVLRKSEAAKGTTEVASAAASNKVALGSGRQGQPQRRVGPLGPDERPARAGVLHEGLRGRPAVETGERRLARAEVESDRAVGRLGHQLEHPGRRLAQADLLVGARPERERQQPPGVAVQSGAGHAIHHAHEG